MSVLELTKANCKNCYKCIRNCPIKAIQVQDDQAMIIENDCILCGNCVLVCPQNAKHIRCDIDRIKAMLQSSKKVIATVAPSYISEFHGMDFEQFKAMLIKLGFADAQETAKGAYVVKSEYEKLLDAGTDILISSCCPTVVSLVQKHYPALLKYVAPVVSPMQAHARLIREEYPDSFVVFIGPCFSKKEEASKYGDVDGVLTFEELSQMLDSEHINPEDYQNPAKDKFRSRFFPISGGIIKSMKENDAYQYIPVDGIEECINVLKELENGGLDHCFIEMSACKFGCINGPSIRHHNRSALEGRIQVTNYASTAKDFDVKQPVAVSKQLKSEYVSIVQPGEKQIAKILKEMGKESPEDELNCGTCGYSTCREKAVAVYYGKASITMCLPYMRQKAESLSDQIISETPNAIITVDEELNINQINKTACRMFNIQNPKDILKLPVSTLMDADDFEKMLLTHQKSINQTTYLPEYDKYVEQTMVYDQSSKIIISIMKDITEDILKNEQVKHMKDDAVQIADNVIEKQMRVVQEIASLLGETTAETQVALSKLKGIITLEDQTP